MRRPDSGGPDSGAPRDEGAPVLERLWALCGARPPAEYAPPWGELARELWEALAAALAADGALGAAGPAARLGYPACARALARAAPAVHRVVSEIRGLALAARDAGPGPAPKQEAPAPGAPLVYESLAY